MNIKEKDYKEHFYAVPWDDGLTFDEDLEIHSGSWKRLVPKETTSLYREIECKIHFTKSYIVKLGITALGNFGNVCVSAFKDIFRQKYRPSTAPLGYSGSFDFLKHANQESYNNSRPKSPQAVNDMLDTLSSISAAFADLRDYRNRLKTMRKDALNEYCDGLHVRPSKASLRHYHRNIRTFLRQQSRSSK